MNTHADNTTENKSQAIANSLPKPQSSRESAFQFVDNRSETIAQNKLHEEINNSLKVKQLIAYHEMANNCSQVKQLRAYQAMVDNYTSQKTEFSNSISHGVIQLKPPIDRNIFNYTDIKGVEWIRDEDDRWYVPSDRLGQKEFFDDRVITNYDSTIDHFINDVLNGALMPSSINWEHDYASKNLLWVLPFSEYSCQIHIHHDPRGIDPNRQPTKCRGHIISNNRNHQYIVNNFAINLLDQLVPRDRLWVALDSWRVQYYNNIYHNKSISPLA